MEPLSIADTGMAAHNQHMPDCVIRAQYSDRAVRVYQAFAREIAEPALAAGRFVPPFKRDE
jgi:Domain of unknown function (DUF4291)